MKDRINLIRFIALPFNLVIVFFIVFIIYWGTNEICNSYTANSFISMVNALPINVERIFVYIIVMFFFLFISFFAREISGDISAIYKYILIFFECSISVAIIYTLDFNYNGILFWTFSSILFEIKSDKSRYIVGFALIFLLFVTNYELISKFIDLYRFSDYINALNNSSILYITYNVLVSVNMVTFIMFLFLLILKKDNIILENELLYKKLFSVNEELLSANDELKKVAHIRESMGETRERNRLAREIHDTLGHSLTGILAGVEACIITIDEDIEYTKKQLTTIEKVARSGIIDVRNSVRKLKPDSLHKVTLNLSIKKIIDDSEKLSNMEFEFTSNIMNEKFCEDEENAIFRLVQESITNAVRYSNASSMSITIEKIKNIVTINIKDNGDGCEDLKMGFGIKHVEERINMLGGSVFFDGSNGFSIKAIISLRGGLND
ncbi:MAG: sensor histidine kinase [Lachnospirales bacterium]